MKDQQISNRCLTAGTAASLGAVIGTAGIIALIVLLFIHQGPIMGAIATGAGMFAGGLVLGGTGAGLIASAAWKLCGEPVARMCQRRQRQEQPLEEPPGQHEAGESTGTGKMVIVGAVILYAVTSLAATALVAYLATEMAMKTWKVGAFTGFTLGTAGGILAGISFVAAIVSGNFDQGK